MIDWTTGKMQVEVDGKIEMRPFEIQIHGYVRLYEPSHSENELIVRIIGNPIPKIIKIGE